MVQCVCVCMYVCVCVCADRRTGDLPCARSHQQEWTGTVGADSCRKAVSPSAGLEKPQVSLPHTGSDRRCVSVLLNTQALYQAVVPLDTPCVVCLCKSMGVASSKYHTEHVKNAKVSKVKKGLIHIALQVHCWSVDVLLDGIIDTSSANPGFLRTTCTQQKHYLAHSVYRCHTLRRSTPRRRSA